MPRPAGAAPHESRRGYVDGSAPWRLLCCSKGSARRFPSASRRTSTLNTRSRHARYVLVYLQSASGACRVCRLRSRDTASGAQWGRKSGLLCRGRIRRRAHARQRSLLLSREQCEQRTEHALAHDRGGSGSPRAAMAWTTSGARSSSPRTCVTRTRVTPSWRARAAREGHSRSSRAFCHSYAKAMGLRCCLEERAGPVGGSKHLGGAAPSNWSTNREALHAASVTPARSVRFREEVRDFPCLGEPISQVGLRQQRDHLADILRVVFLFWIRREQI